MELNSLLQRQLRKHLGTVDEIPAGLGPLLNAVSESYNHYEEDRKLNDRAMELSSRELMENNQDLVRKNELLDAFVYRVGHDLKSPIQNLLALTQMLLELQPASARENVMFQKTVHNIAQTAARMEVRVADLLDLSRMEIALDAMHEELDIQATMELVLQELQLEIQKSGAQVSYEFSAVKTLRFGRENLHSLLNNLLSNSIKYRSEDRVPVISVSTYPEGNFDVLKIQDNGLGIDLEKNGKKIFGMFNRFHSHVAGTGVGLFIIKKIIDKMGGKIHVDSTVGEGTTFSIYLTNAKRSNTDIAPLNLAD